MIARGKENFDWAVSVLKKATETGGNLPKDGFYGTVSFTIQDGLIVAAKTEKSEKPPSL